VSIDESHEPASPQGAGMALGVFLAGLILLIAAVGAFYGLRPRAGPPPKAIAHDPVLVEGRETYLARCVSCHGTEGHGDGPIAQGLSGPPPRDFSAPVWRYGDQPEQIIASIANGVPNSTMPGWANVLTPEQIRAVAAYVAYLGGRRR
jgi:cytochrome c oxidase cbb3-type subunit 3